MHLGETTQGAGGRDRPVAKLIVVALDLDHILALGIVGGEKLVAGAGRRGPEEIDAVGPAARGRLRVVPALTSGRSPRRTLAHNASVVAARPHLAWPQASLAVHAQRLHLARLQRRTAILSIKTDLVSAPN